jgi:hypothetical protein
MEAKVLSFWEKESFNASYDVIVIGAGIVGLSTAYFYKRKHAQARVLVLERGYYPEGASTKNAGFACFGSVTELLDDMKTEHASEVKARVLRRYRGLELLRNELGASAIGFEMTGGFEIFDNEAEYEAAMEHLPMFNEWLAEILSQRNVYEPTVCGPYKAIRNKLEGAIHTGKMMQALIQKATAQGVEIRFNTPLLEYDETSVLVGGGIRLQYDKLLFATNGFTGKLIPELTIKPARGLVFVTEPLPNLMWKGVYHYDKGYIYFRNIDGRLLLGGARNLDFEGETTDEFGVNALIKEGLLAFASRVLMLPENWKIAYEWSGIMGFADTKTPVLKALNDHQFIAAGLGGMGVALGMGLGKDAASLMSIHNP